MMQKTLQITKLKFACKTCDENKITKQPHKQNDKPELARQPQQRVHSDLCRPITPTARGGQNYIISFLDEFFSMLFTYNIRHKSDATTALKQFIADVASIGNVKEIHTDNGMEYLGQSFEAVLCERGINHTTTALTHLTRMVNQKGLGAS